MHRHEIIQFKSVSISKHFVSVESKCLIPKNFDRCLLARNREGSSVVSFEAGNVKDDLEMLAISGRSRKLL